MLRCILVPFLIFDALDGKASWWFIIVFIVAFALDLIDGPIARRLNAATPFGSKLDSIVDVVLFGGILYCAWMIHRQIIDAYFLPIMTLLLLQIISWIISLIKYGKLTCYHSYIAKFWALAISVAIISLFAFNYAGIFFWIAITSGIISNIQDIIMTLMLPKWSCDVLTLGAAFKLRKELT